MKHEQIIEVYKLLRGDTSFHGESHSDEASLNNLKEETLFLTTVVYDLATLYVETKERYEYSGMRLSAQAKKCLETIRDIIDDFLGHDEEKELV